MAEFPDQPQGTPEDTYIAPAAEPSPQGAVAIPTPAPLAPGPNTPVSNQQTPQASPYDPVQGTPEDVILPPPPEAPPPTEEQKFREMFRSQTEYEEKMERTRLHFVDAQQATVAGAGLAATLKWRSDQGDEIAKDELSKLKLDILAYKMMPASGTVGEYYAATSGQVAGSLLAVENLLNPFLSMPLHFARAAPVVSRMLGYGLPQAAIQGYSDYLSQSLSVQAGTREKIDPIQVATAIPIGGIFGTLPAFMRDGKMVRPGEGLRRGESPPPNSLKADDLAAVSPELTPGIPPMVEKAPPGAFQPGRPPAAIDITPHAGAEAMPPPTQGFVRLYRADDINDDNAAQVFFTRQSFKDATTFIDVPEHIAIAAQVGESDRILLPKAVAEGRAPLPKAPPAPPKPDVYAETVAPPLTREQAIARQRAIDAAEAKRVAAGEAPRQREKQPQSLLEWVESMGGLKGKEPEIRDLELPKNVVRPKGKRAKAADTMLFEAKNAKRVPEETTLNRFIEMISEEAHGVTKHYHPGDLSRVKVPDQKRLQIEGDVDAVLRDIGQHPDQTKSRADKADRRAIRERAIRDIYTTKDRDVTDAVYDATAWMGEHGRGRAGAKPFADEVDIPFDVDTIPPAGGRAGEPGAGVRGAGAEPPAGRGAPVASIEDDVSARHRILEGKTIAGAEGRPPAPGVPLTSPSGVTSPITPVESLQSMMTRITDMLGLMVRKGVTLKGATAQFDFASEIARIGETGPQGVKRWLHEVGHFVELRVGKPLTEYLNANEGSLRAFLGNDIPDHFTPAMIKRDGFGEFIAAYVTNHPALVIQDEPFTRVWQDMMEKEAPDLLDIINQAKSAFELYNTAPAINVGLGTIRSPHALTKLTTVGELPYDKRDFMGPVGRVIYNLYTSVLSPAKFLSGQDALAAGDAKAQAIYKAVFNENAWVLTWRKTAANLYRHFGLGEFLPLDPTNDITTFLKIYGKGSYGKTVQDLEHGILRFSDEQRMGEGLTPVLQEVTADVGTGLQPTHEVAMMRFDMMDTFLAARTGRQIYIEQAAGRLPLSDRNPVPWSLAQTEQIIKDTLAMFPHFEALAKRIVAFRKNIVKFEVDARTRSPASGAELMQPQYSDSVPLMRDMTGMTEAFDPSGKLKPDGLETLGRYTREGSERDILSPIRMIIDELRVVNEQAVENQPKLMMRDAIRLFNEGKPGPNKASRWLGEEIPNERVRAADISVRDVLFRAAKQAGFQTPDAHTFANRGVQELGEDMRVQMYRQEQIKKGEKPIMFGWDGEHERFAIQFPSNEMGRGVVDVMDSMGTKGVKVYGQGINLMADVMGFGTGAYRTLTTGTLTYQLKSSVMDAFVQWLQIPEVGFFKGFPLFFRQLASGIKSEITDDVFWTGYKAHEGFVGGATRSFLEEGSRKGLLNLERDIRPINMSPWREQKLRIQAAQAEQARLGNELRDVGIEPHRGLFMNSVQSVVAVMERTEAWGRTGAFKAIYEANIAMNRSHKYASVDAAAKAIDITDYRQHGSGMEAMSRTIPFLSSSLAGLEKFFRTYKTILGKKVDTVAEREYQQQMRLALIPRVLSVMTVAGGIQAWMRDDPTYQRISPETKAKYIILKLPFIGSGTYSSINGTQVELPEGLQGAWLFIPKPWEQGTVMNLAEHAVEFLMTGGNTAEISKFVKSMQYTFSVPNFLEPPLLKTINALKSGVDPWSGRPLVSASKANLPPHMQSSEYTRKFYVSIAQGLNMAWDSRDARKWLHENIPMIGAVLASPWSPMEAQYMMQGFLGDMPRELGGFYNTARAIVTGDPMKMQDVPMLRTFIKDRMAMGAPTQELYNQIKQTNGRLTQALHGFQNYVRQGDQIAAQTYLNGLDQQQRDYIRLHEAKAGPLANVFHPADRGSQLMSAVRTLKDGLLGDNGIESLAAPGTRIKLDPNRLDKVIIALSEYAATESRNSLIVQGVDRFKNLPVVDTRPYFDYIAALSPAVANELSARLAQNKVMTIPALQKYWPQMQKALRTGSGAFPTIYRSEVASIASQASALGYEGGGRKFGRSAVDSQGRVIRRARPTPTILPAEGAVQ